ncbi:ABC transporter ATP-binding protein [Williamsia sp. SKLECPSW1]
MAIIRVEQLAKTYPGGRGVVDVGFTVEEGEIVGVLGPNGAGKTTTVECIGGLRDRDGGVVDVAGFDPAHESAGFREILGIQLQESTLPAKLRVGEALELYAALYAHPADTGELAARLGLADHLTVPFASLSGGQKQRLSVALALVGRPRVAILDELTTGLDPQARREVWSLLEDLRADGVTLLLVSHFMEEAQRLCDRVVLIDHGRVVAQGTPADLAGRVAGGRVISVTPSTPIDVDLLRRLPSVSDVVESGTALRIRGTDDALADIVTILRDNGSSAQHLHVDEPTLDDAFVALTDPGKVSR